MSRAFGQVTNTVLEDARLDSAISLRDEPLRQAEEGLSPDDFMEQVETGLLVGKVGPERLRVLRNVYARIFTRAYWLYLSHGGTGAGNEVPEMPADKRREFKRLGGDNYIIGTLPIGYTQRLEKLFESLGDTNSAWNIRDEARQRLRALQQARAEAAAPPAPGPLLSPGRYGLTDEQFRAAAHLYNVAFSRPFTVPSPDRLPNTKEALFLRAARVWSRLTYLGDKEQTGTKLTKQEREEMAYLDKYANALIVAFGGTPGQGLPMPVSTVVVGAVAVMRRAAAIDRGSAAAAMPAPKPLADEQRGTRAGCDPLTETTPQAVNADINNSWNAKYLSNTQVERLQDWDNKFRCRRLYLISRRGANLTADERTEVRELGRRRAVIRDELARRNAQPASQATADQPTTTFEEGEVQGSFLLPGGSTLTAEQSRLKRLREYVNTLTGGAKVRGEKFLNFYTNIYAPRPESDRWRTVGRDELYVATLLCPKEDPLGRFLLCDVLYNPSTKYVYVYLAGTMQQMGGMVSGPKGLMLGNGYSTATLRRIGRNSYARSHTPGGVVIHGVGLGTVLYSAHALAANVYRGADGCYSDGSRSDEAEAWWKRAVDDGFAEGEGGNREDTINHCESISDRSTDDGGWIQDSEVCADVTVEYESAGETWLNADRVLKEDLVAFGVVKPMTLFAGSVQFPVTEWHRPFWDTFKVRLGETSDTDTEETGLFLENIDGAPYAKTGDKVKMDLSDETAEMLARSFHGQSPVLAASIIEALVQSGKEEQAVVYATRADIASLLAGNATLKRLLETRRLPGVAGLSERRHGQIMQAVGLAGLGQATADVTGKNPLHLPPLSAKTKRRLAKFKDMD